MKIAAAEAARTEGGTTLSEGLVRVGRMARAARVAGRAALACAAAAAAAWAPGRLAADTIPAFPVREVAYDMDVRLDFAEEKLFADVKLTVRNHRDLPTSEIPLLLYRLLTVRGVEGPEGEVLPFRQAVAASPEEPKRQVNEVRVTLDRPLQPDEETTLRIEYDGFLAGYVETGSLYVKDRIDGEFTILRKETYVYPQVGRPGVRWEQFPSFAYKVSVEVPATHVVANGGKLLSRVQRNARTTWTYENLRPAWRLDFAVAPYGLLEEGDLRVFYLPGDSVGGARVLDAFRRSMALYEEWFGPLLEAPQLAVIEIPDGWGSQKDETAVLQTAAAFQDPGRLYEVYHEASHFWNVPPSEMPSPRLNEGLASYLEDLTTEVLDGHERVEPSISRLEVWVRDAFAGNAVYRETPMARYGEREISGLSYGVGALMFYALEEIVGPETFREIIGSYYRRYAGSGAGVRELARVADEAAGIHLDPFFRDWLFTTAWYEHIAAGKSTAEYAASYRAVRAGAG